MEPARRKRRLLLQGCLLAAAAFSVFYWLSHREGARAATAYGSRVACSCRHVGDRALDQCRDEFLPGMNFIMLSEDEGDKAVTAWMPFFGSETARYRDGSGCVLDSWAG